MRRLFSLLLLLVLLPLPAQAADEGVGAAAAWFQVDEKAAADWQITRPDPADDQRLLIRRRSPPAGLQAAPVHRVMVIYPRKSSAYDVAMGTLLQDFAARPLALEFLAVNFGGDPQRGARLIEEAEREGHALIYAMGSETVDWLYQAHRGAGIPVVTICAKDPVQLGQMPDYAQGSGSNFAFTSLNLLLDVQVEYLQELKPGLKNIGILVDSRNASAVETQARPIAEALCKQGVRVINVAVSDPARAREQLAALLPQAVAEMRQNDPALQRSVFWITGSTSVFAEISTINAHSDKVPVLAVVPEVVQAGADSAVLSIGVSFESNAQLAAVYGADILMGKAKPGDLKVGVVSPPDIALNFQRARAIGLKIPFGFFEAATFIYDAEGRPVRLRGQDMR
jgi:putative ABC transport system substrate-binding protein